MGNIHNSNMINNLDLKMYYCGTQACPSNHSWGPAIKEHYKIHYIHSGKGIFKFNDKTYHLEKGQGFLICPNVVSYYEADSVDPWDYSWCAFDGFNADSYLNRANLSIDNPIFNYNKNDKLNECFKQMMEAIYVKKSNDLRLQSLLYLFLAIIIDESDETAASNLRSINKNMYVSKIIEFIRLNYSHKIKIGELAKHIGLDRKYMSSLFKSAVGITLQDYLINFRLNKANDISPKEYRNQKG
ncbi:AraC family transcriptional regulator [Clostridium oryzae]|uniref:HTH-type transcriptional activator RhaS n=1 Tax=Clostridium oryzae TaxID=1450648 RepID=A0A1V4IS23_9CLOT|nr:AraC family transcriptional regulator [Clostridium oryzae]OPJ62726.1 HTH-type transcriptional activator RhaS [Clostridium oryzae]